MIQMKPENFPTFPFVYWHKSPWWLHPILCFCRAIEVIMPEEIFGGRIFRGKFYLLYRVRTVDRGTDVSTFTGIKRSNYKPWETK